MMDHLLLRRLLYKNYNIYILCGLFVGLLCVQTGGTKSPCHTKTQFPCRTAPHICIELSHVRDGRIDCPDGSDEECPDGMYECKCGTPKCIQKKKVGDGVKDCQDGSDEGEDGSNYLCPETFEDDDPFAIEMKKRRRKRHSGHRNDPIVYPSGIISAFIGTEVNGDRTTYHTTQLYRTYIDGTYTELLQSTSVISPTPTQGMASTSFVNGFGSLNSGKVYLTAVNEPISSLSSSMLETDSPFEVTGTFIPPIGKVVTKHFGLDLSARTIGTLYPEKSQSSIILVTGTAGTFVRQDPSLEMTFPVYTGSYISGLETPTTYKFFFGHQPLTSDVKIIIPTAISESGENSDYLGDESDLEGSILRRNDVEDEEDLLSDSDIAEPHYVSSNSSKELYASVSEIKPIAITRYVQPSASHDREEAVLAFAGHNTVGVIGNIRKSQNEHSLRGHQGHSRQGRMYDPANTGRRVGQGGATIITDQFFFPGHRMETTATGNSRVTNNKDLNIAYYDFSTANLNDQFRKLVKPTVVKDLRLTRTVGLYGPIYEVEDLKNDASTNAREDEDLSNSMDSSNDGNEIDFTTTLYGFAEFSTQISGTHYIFLPASTRPRTFTPRVTRTSFSNGFSGLSRSQSSDSSESQPEAFFRKPLFGTDTREFISQKSMFTSTVKEPIEIQKTMFTSTVMTKQFTEDQTRARKVDDSSSTIIAETLPLNLATIYTDETEKLKTSTEKDITLNFQPFYKHTPISESSIELDVSEIIDSPILPTGTSETQHPTGLVSSITGTEVSDGTTTHWKTLIFGTYIDNTYAHIIESTSSIFFTVSKTTSPEESLFTNSENVDESIAAEATITTSNEKSFESGINLISSLSETPTKTTNKFDSSSDYTAMETPRLEILTSGFIFPSGNFRNIDGHKTSSEYTKTDSDTTKVLLTNNFFDTTSKIIPEVMYEDSEETSSSEMVSSSEDKVHILTNGFILPITEKFTTPKPVETESNESVTKNESTTHIPSTSDSNLLLDKLTGVTNPDTDDLITTNRESVFEIDSHENASENVSNVDNLKPSVVFLTGDFILPSSPKTELPPSDIKEKSDTFSTDKAMLSNPSIDSSAISLNTPSIITDGFIFPNLETSSTDSVIHALPSSALLVAGRPEDIKDQALNGRSAGDQKETIVLDNEIKPSLVDHSENENSKSLNDENNKFTSFTRTAKSLDVSSDRVKIEEILPSVVFPVTYYTTSTYFTTYFSGGSTIVSSRKETESNIYTDREHLKSAKLNPTKIINVSQTVSPTHTKHPSEDLTTFTYYTTSYIDGSKIISSREEIKTDEFHEKPSSYSLLTYPTTYYTTLTYFTTLIQDSKTKIVSSETVISNVVTPSLENAIMKTSTDELNVSVQPTESGILPTTFYTTYTYYTTFHKDGTTSVSTTYKTTSNVIYGEEFISSTPSLSIDKTDTVSESEPRIPTTYFTTFTYYTTFLRDGTPAVSSREEVISSIAGVESIKSTNSFKTPVNTVDPPITPQKTTFYTTYTYYTTLLKDGVTSVITRKDTVSNVADGNSQTISVTPTKPASNEITATPTVKTYFTTYTYYTTYLRDGTSVISTREDTLTNFVTESPDFQTQTATPSRSFNTYYTTLTSYYTLYQDGNPSVKTVFSTLTDVVALSPVTETNPVPDITPSTSVYYKTHTFYTTIEESGTSVVSKREQVTSRTVTIGETVDPITVTHAVIPFETKDSLEINPASVVTKTYYTTFTFFTTYLYKGTPSITTRLETSTNYITETLSNSPLTSHTQSVSPTKIYENVVIPTSTHGSINGLTNNLDTDLKPSTYSSDESTTHLKTHASSDSVAHSPGEQVLNTIRDSTPSLNSIFKTVFTTFTYYNTLYSDGSPIVDTRLVTTSNIIAMPSTTITKNPSKSSSDLDAAEGGLHENRIHPTPAIDNFTTHTYVATTLDNNGNLKYVTKEVVYTGTAALNEDAKSTSVCCTEVTKYPYTFYTTYTYYTTRYHGESPIINTRYETITNVIKAPLRTDPASYSDIKTTAEDSIINSMTKSVSNEQETTAHLHPLFYNPPSLREESLKPEVTDIANGRVVSERTNIETTTQKLTTEAAKIVDENTTTESINEKLDNEILNLKPKLSEKSNALNDTVDYVSRENLDSTETSTEHLSESTFGSTANDAVENSTMDISSITNDIENATTSTKIETTTEIPKKSIFARRRNRPAYKPRPSFRSSTSAPVASAFKPTQKSKLTTTTTTTTRIPISGIRRNTSRILFRRPTSNQRPNPLDRLRPRRPTPPSAVTESDDSASARRRRSFFKPENHVNFKPRFRNLLSTEGDENILGITNNNDLIANRADSFSDKKPDKNEDYKLGLIKSMDSKVVNNGVVTVYGTEIHGTFINGVYAQVVQSKVRIYSDTSNEIEKTSIAATPTLTPSKIYSTSEAKKVGLVSSRINTAVRDGITTIYTTNTYGTYIGDVYAHLAQTTSNIIKPTPTEESPYKTGLISSIISTDINYDTTTLYTTNIYGTFVNKYYAHVASTFSNIHVGEQHTHPTPLPSSFQNQLTTNAISDSNAGTPTARSIEDYKTYKTGLLSSILSEDVKEGTTTQYITNIYGTYIGEHYAKHAKTTSSVIEPSSTESGSRSIGLLSTIVNSVVNQGMATIYKTEILGTYIGQHYAQLARTSTEYKVLPTKSTELPSTTESHQKTGLITSSVIRSEVNSGTTTMHLNEIYGTYIGNAYAHIAKSTSKIIQPTDFDGKHRSTSKPENQQKTGLISSNVKTEVNEGTTTLHISEIHGTYVGNYYAHVARRTSTVLPFTATPAKSEIFPTQTATNDKSEGLISSDIRTEINYDTTTLHTREVYGTFINGFYAHVARSTSNIITPTPSSTSSGLNTGLVSVLTNSQVNGDVTTLYTTEIYGTKINGFYAHIARSSSIIITNTPVLPTSINLFGVISATTSTEINYGITTLHRISVIGTEIDGSYIQSVKKTSTIISTPSVALEVAATPVIVAEALTSFNEDLKLVNTRVAKDELNTAQANELDNGNQYISLTEDIDLVVKPSLEGPEFNLLSPINPDFSVLVTSNQIIPTTSTSLQFSGSHESTNDITTSDTTNTSMKNTEIESTTQTTGTTKEITDTTKKPEKITKSPLDEYDEYNEYTENKAHKDSAILKPIPKDQNIPPKSKTPTISSSRSTELNDNYDDYGFEDDYDDFNDRKISKKVTPSLSSTTRFKNTRQTKRKTSTYTNRDYDDYDDYDLEDNEETPTKSTKSSDISSTKETPSSSVRIRPFTGRGRPTFTTTARSSTKASYTIQFRRPSRTRNSRAFGSRSDSENDFDDELNESDDDEGDIEASEAVVTTATPQVLSFNRRKPFGSRQQSQNKNSVSSSTPRTPSVGRNRRPFGRSSFSSPSPTPSLREVDPDYDENTTEDEDFDDYDDIADKKEANRNRNFRSTRRPPSRQTRYGERRSASNKRGSFRHREEEETENDDFDTTTPNYRNSRNRINPRKPSRNRYNRNNSPSLKASFNSVSRDEDEDDDQSLQPLNRIRNNNRNRRPSYNPRTRRPSKTVSETETIRKPFLTVTSVVTTVKTLPIYHGFRTSYATLTTTALDTSIISPAQYSEVTSDGIIKTLFYSRTGYPDGIENLHTTITEVVVTTTSLASVKLVPIKIGFSTRTDTITDIQVLTTLSTVYSTITPDAPLPTAFPQQFQPNFYPPIPQQNPDFGLVASANSFITTQIVTSTTVVPIILRGRTILSTLTTTSTSETTVVQTVHVPHSAPNFIPQPYFAFQPLTTLITLYVTGEYGELKPVVTTVTVPLYQQPVFHTKVARSLQQNIPSEHTLKTADIMDLQLLSSIGQGFKKDIDIDTHYDQLLSSGLEEINDLSEINNANMQTEPLDSTKFMVNGVTSYDVTTISKGPLTEIYEQKVTINLNPDSILTSKENIETIKDTYGLESSYNFRRLQQFVDEDLSNFKPQRDFTRLRRPPADVILTTAPNPNILSQPSTQLVPPRNRARQFTTIRRPLVNRFNDEFANNGLRNDFIDPLTRGPLRQPESNFRPFLIRTTPIPPNFFNELSGPRENYSPIEPTSSYSPVDELVRIRNAANIPINRNNDEDSLKFRGSLPDEDNFGGFRPITNPPGLRRSPGSSINDESASSEGNFRPRRLRITRPVNNLNSATGGLRRVTKVRVTPTPSLDLEEDSTVLPTIDFKEEEISTTITNDLTDSSHSLFSDSISSITPEDNNFSEGTGNRRTIIRRLKPSYVIGDGSGPRRPVVVRRTRPSEHSTPSLSSSSLDTRLISNEEETPEVSTVFPTSPVVDKNLEVNEDANEFTKPPLKKVIRVRKPENSDDISVPPRRRIVISRRPPDAEISPSNVLQGRGPVVSSGVIADKIRPDIVSENSYDVSENDNNLEALRSIVSKSSESAKNFDISIFSTKQFPLTYYTTLTYFTTFLHGQDTNYASREATFSNVIEQTLNPSLLNIIKSKNGLLSTAGEADPLHLASRTLGDTTTIVNLASKQNIYNSDVFKIISDIELTKEPILITSRLTVIPSKQETSMVFKSLPVNDIASLPKTYLTLFTYSYTIFDGVSKRESTRAETMTKLNADPSQFLRETIGSFINGEGILTIGPETRTVQLGSREVEGTTTEVNLGLRTLVKFDGLQNVAIEKTPATSTYEYITPSRTVAPEITTTVASTPDNFLSTTHIDSSYSTIDNELYDTREQANPIETAPLYPSDLNIASNIVNEPKSVVKITSVIHKPGQPLRSGVFVPRPGVRVRVKPVVSRRLVPSDLVSSFDISFDVNELATEQPASETVSPQYILPGVNMGVISTPVLEDSYLTTVFPSDGIRNEIATEDYEMVDEEVTSSDGAVVPSRKKLKVTVRRQSESISRTHTRFVLPSRFEITSRPRFYVVTRTGALGVVSNTQRPFTVKISRKVKPSATEVGLPSTTVIYDTYTTLTTVPVIFGLDTSFRNVILTTSSPITVSFVPTTLYETEDVPIMPSTVVFTYFTTTTFTIPYIDGDQTIFTTLEETNSRIVTQTIGGIDTLSYSTVTRTPQLQDEALSTSVEFGFDGPTTHTLQPESFIPTYKNIPPEIEVSPTIYETKTFYTTYTFFSTFLAGTEPIVTSSEQIVTNVVTVPITTKEIQPSSTSVPVDGPITVFDTSKTIVTKTEYNTITFFATLFSDTSSFVTPIEEVETKLIPVTEFYTISRTINPGLSTSSEPSSFKSLDTPSIDLEPSVVVTQTLYTTLTNFVTLFQGTDTVVTNLEETISNVVTLTVPAHAASSFIISSTPVIDSYASTEYFTSPTYSPVYTTKEILSTQTHYLTLFNGDQSILSSIVEVVTNFVTELATPTSPTYVPEAYFTSSSPENVVFSSIPSYFSESVTPSYETSETTSEIQTYHPELVPSIRTIYSTITFYTTYFSDTSSIVASQEEVLTSFVTLFVPPSLVTSTTTSETTTEQITPTSTLDPSVFVFTTTDYSTLTLYTTLFSGDEIVVISSEHVVPEVITATITPSSVTPSETSTSDESVLTFLTTFTYYTTYFSGTDPVIASSESVVTQFVTIEAPPSPSTTDVIDSTPVVDTLLDISATRGSDNIISSFKDDLSGVEIIGVSSNIETAVASSVGPKVEIESKVHSEIGLIPVSSPTIPSFVVSKTSIDELSSSFDEASVDATSSTSTDILPSKTSTSSEMISPVTSTSLVTSETEVIGVDGRITTLTPSDTLVLVTGTDGFVTKIPEVETAALSPVYIPSVVEISESTTSEIKPATVIELSDLLGGNTALGGDIGLKIQDIVSRITGKKNKTEVEYLTTEMIPTDTTSEDKKLTEVTTEQLDKITKKTTVEITTESTTEKESKENVVIKDFDYPIFVLPSKTEVEINATVAEPLAPIYVPAKPKETEITESDSMSSDEVSVSSSQSKTFKTGKTPIVSTSVISGARTVFIIPTRKISPTESIKEVYDIENEPTVEARHPIVDFDPATKIDSSMSPPIKESTRKMTQLLPSIGTSIISGIRTIFFGSSTDKTTQLKTSSTSTVLGRANAATDKPKTYTTSTKDGQTVVSRTTSGATTIFFPGQIPKYTANPITTRYVTSVESITRTLALTTTRTYYTRDSTLTVPSVYTTTIPPRTFVSTIIGSRTILGILPEPSETVQIHRTLEPSEHTTTITTTTLIFNSIPSTVIRTLVLPTGLPTKVTVSDSSSTSAIISEPNIFSAGTEKPVDPPEVLDSTLVTDDDEAKLPRTTQKARDETYLRAAGPRLHDSRPESILEYPVHRPPIVVTEPSNPEDDPFLNGRNGVCDPKCQPYKKEVCKESNGFWSCQCRPGHARRNEHEICKEIQTYVVLLKVVKMGNESIHYSKALADNETPQYKEFVQNAKVGIADAYGITNVRDHVWNAEVNNILPVDRMDDSFSATTLPTNFAETPAGVIVNFTLHVSKSVSGDLLEQELTRSLQMSSMRIGDSSLLAAPLSQNVQDYDECLDFRQNDCALRATCINLEGTFTCQCNEGFEDMDLNLPGRICLAKTENCNFCHGRGDCLRDDDDKTFCRCQPMFVGRRCEINGLVLAIALPTAVAVLVLLLCAVLCCCRKCKKKSPPNHNGDPGSVFKGIALKGPVEGTLDRKAMIDTSSESSGEHPHRKGIPFEGYQESGDVTPYKSSKRSDLSLNRSLSTGYTSPPVMIPRARQPPQTPQGGKPMNYTVYDGQVYVW